LNLKVVISLDKVIGHSFITNEQEQLPGRGLAVPHNIERSIGVRISQVRDKHRGGGRRNSSISTVTHPLRLIKLRGATQEKTLTFQLRVLVG
jgi:hypothetical protein